MKGKSTSLPKAVEIGDKAETPESIRRLTCLSVTHRTHSTEEVGRVAPDNPVEEARRISDEDRVTEATVLSTCNRVEVYLSTRTPSSEDRATAIEVANERLGLPAGFRTYVGGDVARHLSKVAAGLESAILGEDEIIGQVSDAFASAKEADVASGVLGRVGDASLRVGRLCRTETRIDEGPTDYGGAVCRAIERSVGGPPDRLLVVGAGGMARTVSEAARARWDVRLDVANRSPAHGLPSEEGRWWSLDRLGDAVEDADAVVTATSADRNVFGVQHAERADVRAVVVDISTPPDVSEEARNHANLDVKSLAELGAMVRSESSRSEAVERAQEIIDDAVERLVASERENRAEDVLRSLHSEARDAKEEELERAKLRLEEGDAPPEEVLEDFGAALTSRVLASPTERLRTAAREGDETVIRAARRLFSLGSEGDHGNGGNEP